MKTLAVRMMTVAIRIASSPSQALTWAHQGGKGSRTPRWRHSGIVHEAFDVVKGLPHLRGWARGQPCPLPRRWVGDVVMVIRGLSAKQEAVAVVHDLENPGIKSRSPEIEGPVVGREKNSG